ncbi:Uu.00g052030.m01.CDS01 [Anthostomella pinea]|uniref:Uu.00g052030.m01.CDS01 n=1 Tax=Anthostomella pinea TaxID=933095 RepID=A0AAI8VW76_9PEZI|nr:Uu.00g052030.m01.CDS01 [Anthostomella pinea]
MGAFQSKVVKEIQEALNHDVSLYAFPFGLGYQSEHVRRYNLDITTTPIAVTYPKTTAQVAAIVKIAANAGLKVQAKSGGHSYAKYSSPDGGIIVDLKHFQKFEMDPKTWWATVGAGTLLGDLTKRVHDPRHRAMAHGTCPQVGIGGHATIGGLGPSSRLFGAALDHIEEVEVVLADGSIKRASTAENADLFWALKGAAASFGIITDFVVHTELTPDEAVQYGFSFTAGTWGDMAQAFKAWQKFVLDKSLDWKFASTATITEAGLAISGTYFGTKAEFDEFAKGPGFPISSQAEGTIVFREWLGLVEHWAEDIALHFGGGIPAHSYTKTLTFNGDQPTPDAVIDKIFEYIKTTKKDVWFAIFDLASGKVNEVPMDATAYAHRDALFYLQSYAISDKLGQNVSNTTTDFPRGLNQLIKSEMAKANENTDFGAYAGYVDPELPDGQKEYWRSNLDRLEIIKAKYDPKDVFHNWQSVRPNGEDVLTPAVLQQPSDLSGWIGKAFRALKVGGAHG